MLMVSQVLNHLDNRTFDMDPSGLYPDYMHMVHLAFADDFLGSMLPEVSEDATIVPGTSRERRLDVLWKDHRLKPLKLVIVPADACLRQQFYATTRISRLRRKLFLRRLADICCYGHARS